jgi:hypothetical protein
VPALYALRVSCPNASSEGVGAVLRDPRRGAVRRDRRVLQRLAAGRGDDAGDAADDTEVAQRLDQLALERRRDEVRAGRGGRLGQDAQLARVELAQIAGGDVVEERPPVLGVVLRLGDRAQLVELLERLGGLAALALGALDVALHLLRQPVRDLALLVVELGPLDVAVHLLVGAQTGGESLELLLALDLAGQRRSPTRCGRTPAARRR